MKNKTRMRSFRFTEAECELMDMLALREGISISKLITLLLREAERKGEELEEVPFE